MTKSRMLGKNRSQRCRWNCCAADDHDGKRAIIRRNKRRERSAWKSEMG
jgi:hypothetical protein